MIPRIEELTESAVVGRYYLVPCLLGQNVFGSRARLWWPIFGGEHADPEILPGSGTHFHFDQRFLSAEQFRVLGGAHYGGIYARVIWRDLEFGKRAHIAGAPELRRRRCMRQFAFPEGGSIALQPKLERFMVPLGTCRRCPHRGFDLRQVPADESGIITCPGHGLRFHAATGKPAPVVLPGVHP